jgi:hypothetical protein
VLILGCDVVHVDDKYKTALVSDPHHRITFVDLLRPESPRSPENINLCDPVTRIRHSCGFLILYTQSATPKELAICIKYIFWWTQGTHRISTITMIKQLKWPDYHTQVNLLFYNYLEVWENQHFPRSDIWKSPYTSWMVPSHGWHGRPRYQNQGLK